MKDLVYKLKSITSLLPDNDHKNELNSLVVQLNAAIDHIEIQRKENDLKKRLQIEFHNDIIKDLGETQVKMENANNLLSEKKKELQIQNKIIENYSIEQQVKIEELKFAYNELEQCARIASHDLKEPLRAISNFSQILYNKYKDLLNKDGVDYLNYIVDGVRQLDITFNDFLKYLQIGSNNQDFKMTDLNRLVGHVKSSLSTFINETQTTLTFQPLPCVMINAPMVYKLFFELINNAIKHRSEEKPQIHISAKKFENDFWLFKIKDNGIGLDEQVADKLFLPFQRFISNGSNHRPIGLATCKKIVKMHQGDIWYESGKNSDKGSTFLFTLAIKAEQVCEESADLLLD